MTEVRFQQPPTEYEQRYFSQLLRDLRQTFIGIMTPGKTTIGFLTLIPPPNGCPTNGAGYPPGTVYSDSGTLKIVLPDVAYAPPLYAATAVGTVTATGS